MKWFRFYHSLLDSVKVRTLPDAAQVDYTLLLCCASEFRERTGRNTGETGLNVEEAAWRMRRASLGDSMPMLIDRGLARFDDAALIVMAGWEERQFASDDSAERERRRYDKKHGRNQALGAGSSPGFAKPDGVPDGAPDVRPAAPDTETDSDTETDQHHHQGTVASQGKHGGVDRLVGGAAQKNAAPPPEKKLASPKRGIRLSRDWKLPREWGEWALTKGAPLGWTADTVREIAETFRDYWIAKPGTNATKLDWQATWQVWIRKELRHPHPQLGAGTLLSAAGQHNRAALTHWLESGEEPQPVDQQGEPHEPR